MCGPEVPRGLNELIHPTAQKPHICMQWKKHKQGRLSANVRFGLFMMGSKIFYLKHVSHKAVSCAQQQNWNSGNLVQLL